MNPEFDSIDPDETRERALEASPDSPMTPDQVMGYSESQAQGFGTGWKVHEYQLRSGVVSIAEHLQRTYAPGGLPQVATDFSKLDPGDEGALLTFVNTWGHLGWSRLKHDGRSPPDPAEPEPVRWIWAHANGVRFALNLAHAYAEFEKRRTKAQVGQGLIAFHNAVVNAFTEASGYGSPIKGSTSPQLTTGSGATITRRIAIHLPPSALRSIEATKKSDSPRPIEPDMITTFVAEVVNPNIGGIRSKLERASATPRLSGAKRVPVLEPGHGFVKVLTFSALIEVIWWHVSNMLSEAGRIRRCEQCGSVFQVFDARRRFCPSVAGSPSSCQRAASRERAAARRGQSAKPVRGGPNATG